MSKGYNHQEREKHWQNFWDKKKIFLFNPKSTKPFYSVDTPPPYVSADHLHVGHIMSYSQAEFIVRYKRMRGFEVFYPMGFDDNGLPTERFVEKKYNINKNKIERGEFVKKCLEETKIGVQVYKNLWRILGVSVDWTKTYSTIDPRSQKISQWSFIDLFKKGRMIHREEPVYWCVSCQTALAQADLEDKEENSFLNYINFTTADGKKLLIATSRPELLPACVALFVNPKDNRYKDLVGGKATVPIFNYEVPILADESVDKEYGTGLMMVCTWGDIEDIEKAKKYNLASRAVFDAKGIMNQLAGEFKGLKIGEARKMIVQKLKADNFIEKQESISHVLNVHERCGTPVEFIEAKQWFIDVLGIKKELTEQTNKLSWYPEFMKQRCIDWINFLKWDWCISRQRYYGVPFPVWYCSKCGETILPEEDSLPVDPTETQPGKNCPKCGSDKFIPEKDVMDTWMTSSCSPIIISRLFEDEATQKKLFPASLRPQGFEIIRTWLFYTLVKSFYHFGGVPFTDVMISGHGLDSKGQKVSKRLGNYEPPEKIIEQYGADSLRYWATGSNLGENLRYNEQEVKKGNRTVTKLHNAAQFCFLHFKDADCSDFDASECQNLPIEDKWILHNLNEVIKMATDYFDHYQYSKARDLVDEFFWGLFCDYYLEIVKHRLYQDAPDEKAKQVLYYCLLSIIKMYAPILPFIAEEIYQAYFVNFEGDTSIHVASWPGVDDKLKMTSEEIKDFDKFLAATKEVRKYRAENKMSLAKELDSFDLATDLPDKYLGLTQTVNKVKKIK